MATRTINRVDLIGGLTFTSLGLAAFIESWRMPRFVERKIDPFTVPGLTPGILSAVIAVLGFALIMRALLGSKSATEVGLPITTWVEGSATRTIFTLTMVAIYGFLLFGNFPFFPVTALFIFAFIMGSEYINPTRVFSLAKTALIAAAVSLFFGYGIFYLFTSVFLVRLPG